MIDHLHVRYGTHDPAENSSRSNVAMRIVSTRRTTASKSCSLLFLRVGSSFSSFDHCDVVPDVDFDNDDDEVALSTFLEDMTTRCNYVQGGLNKMYIMGGRTKTKAGKCCRSLSNMTMRGTIASTTMEVLGRRGGGDVDGHCVGDNTDDEDGGFIERRLLGMLERLRHYEITNNGGDECTKVVARVDVFPMILQRDVISNITALMDDASIPETILDISPNNHTHALCVIKIDDVVPYLYSHSHLSSIAPGRRSNNDIMKRSGTTGTFLVGVSPSRLSAPTIYPSMSSPSDVDDIICRSYRKLAEAFERYRAVRLRDDDRDDDRLPSFPFFRRSCATCGSRGGPNADDIDDDNEKCSDCHRDRATSPLVAIDCGSSPGGWTKYLSERHDIDAIYAIDPGVMNEGVSSLPGVHHLRMTSADAITHLRNVLSPSSSSLSDDVRVALWVGDMCTHEPTGQVDAMLGLRASGLMRPDAAFVLTIKCCNVGHGRDRYDEFATMEAMRLRDMAGAYGVEVMHLFSNRLSERTIIGFVK
jgi:hypothetical protein